MLMPMFRALSLPTAAVVARGGLAFATFSLCASAGYILNDMLDIEADRVHPFGQRARPPW